MSVTYNAVYFKLRSADQVFGTKEQDESLPSNRTLHGIVQVLGSDSVVGETKNAHNTIVHCPRGQRRKRAILKQS